MKVQNKTTALLRDHIAELYGHAIWDSEWAEQLPAPSFTDADIESGKVSFAGTAALALLTTTVEILHSLLPEPPKYSDDFVKKALLRWLRRSRTRATPVDIDSVGDLLSQLRAEAPAEHRVFRAVYGASLNDSANPLALGPCTLYCARSHRDLLAGEGDLAGEIAKWLSQVDVLAEVTVTAVDAKAAFEQADHVFAYFEAFVALTEPHDRDYRRVSIVSEHATYWRPSLIRTRASVQLTRESLGPVELVPLNSAAFTSPCVPMARLWAMLKANTGNGWEERLLRGARWLGDAIACHGTDVAVVRMTTALETLLYLDTEQPYSPSRTAALSEAAAHVLGTSVEHCFEVEKNVKSLYRARSGIVHDGHAGLAKTKLMSLMQMTREILFRLLVDKKWIAINSPTDFRTALSRARYSQSS